MFNVPVKPMYNTKLVCLLDNNTIQSKDISLLLTISGRSLSLKFNTSNIHVVQEQTLVSIKYKEKLNNTGSKISFPPPSFAVTSNVNATTARFYDLQHTASGWGSNEVYQIGRANVMSKDIFISRYIFDKSEKHAISTFLRIGYDSGLFSEVVISSQINASNSTKVFPTGRFSFRASNIYYKDVDTGRGVDGTLYRCSIIGNADLQIQVDNKGTYTNGTDLPHVYIDNGFQKDLYVIKRPYDDCAPALFCQAFYKYRDSDYLYNTKHQLPPRYKPWKDPLDRMS